MPTKNKIVTLDNAIKISEEWRSKNEKVVFTNGCFDIVHLGHIDYLEKARELGTKLILGVNTDASVNRLKPNRPIINEESRYRLLAALEFIDLVVPFAGDTPLELIIALQPSILVKGNDYIPEEIVGYKEVTQNGGTVTTIDLVQGFSTSNIIAKILGEIK